MANKTSPHILGSAANLLGFCLFVIASFHFTNAQAQSIIDEFTSGVGLLLAASCIFSFASLRSQQPSFSKRLETIADYLFLLALIGIFAIILLIALKVLR